MEYFINLYLKLIIIFYDIEYINYIDIVSEFV